MAIKSLSNNASVFTGKKSSKVWDQTTTVQRPAFESIGCLIVPPGINTSNFDFVNIPQTYTHLQIRISARVTGNTAGQSLSLRYNGDTGSNYSFHSMLGSASSTTQSNSLSQTYAYLGFASSASYLGGNYGGNIIDIYDYKDVTKYKTGFVLGAITNSGANFNSGTSAFNGIQSSVWLSTNAINRITISCSSNFDQYSVCSLYGVR